MSVLAAIASLALLLLIHELGHLVCARLVGITPRRFAIFFAPFIWKRRIGELELALGSVPLGGYVRLPGMRPPDAAHLRAALERALGSGASDHEHESKRTDEGLARRCEQAVERGDAEEALGLLAEAEQAIAGSDPGSDALDVIAEARESLLPGSYWRASWTRRVLVALAGPVANLACALVLLASAFMIGFPTETLRVSAVMPGSPAASAGIAKGDVLVAANGVSLDDAGDLRDALATGDGALLAVRHDGKERSVEVRPYSGVVGIELARERKGRNPLDALAAAAAELVAASAVIASTLVDRSGDVSGEIAGPIGIVELASDAAQGGFALFLAVSGLISFSLALFNLLPLLPLDGGQVLLAIAERVRGKPFGRRGYWAAALIGGLVAATLVAFGLWNDLKP